MFALVDCNSFFCSCEKVFHPGLQGRPVCVLSANDGIIIALTPEAKALGLHRGDAIFKVQNIIERGRVAIFSSNLYLYAAMSKRIVSILRQACDRVEVYSIDESFLDLSNYSQHYDLEKYMRALADRIRLWTDVPVSVGIAPTKTLAKMASKFAKNYRAYRSVCVIDNDDKRRKALSLFDLDDVWGVGRKTYAKLLTLGVHTPLEFADKPEAWVRRHFSKPGIQTWCELNGYPCINTEEVARNQSICTSHTFKEMVTEQDQLKAAVTSFAGSCANKLRGQDAVAGSVSVFVGTNPFRKDMTQYWNTASASLPVPSSDTLEIAQTAQKLLSSIFCPGIHYKRAGVILGEISSAKAVQQDMFDPVSSRCQRAELSKTIDDMNHRFGLKTVRLAVEDSGADMWRPRSDHRSPNYLTDINDILTVN